MTKYSIDQFSGITGITKFVLRTWENRYGYLKAERTDTNIRIYNDQMVVRALNTNYLLNHGFKISRIAKLSDAEVMEAVHKIKIQDTSTKPEYYINEIIVAALNFDSIKFKRPFQICCHRTINCHFHINYQALLITSHPIYFLPNPRVAWLNKLIYIVVPFNVNTN